MRNEKWHIRRLTGRGLLRLLPVVVLCTMCIVLVGVATARTSFFISHFAERHSSSLTTHSSFENRDEEPDSLIKARWRIQKTTPEEVADLDSSALDLHMPENIRQEVEYDDSLNVYRIGSRIGDSYLNTPILMSPEEYNAWSERRERERFFRSKNAENVAQQGKEKFSFADMHFDLGPAEKIFGPGGVRIKTQGTAELKLGATLKNIDNPSLPERNRKTTAMDFDEKINLNVTGKVGDKVNMSLNYNTDATFDFDTKNLKLRYEGKEDEIIKLVEAGNVTFPSNNSLVKGASSLFGIRTDMQFGKLKLQTVLSRKNSTSKSVSSKGCPCRYKVLGGIQTRDCGRCPRWNIGDTALSA